MTVLVAAEQAVVDRLTAWRLFVETCTALLWQLETELQTECGIPLTWYDVLLRLDGTPGGRLRMQELVGSLMLTKSGISRLADRMERAGLISRQTCPSDRRGAFAVLTAEGRAMLHQAAPIHRRGIRDHFGDHLDDRDLASLSAALAKLRAATPSRHAGSCTPARCDEGADAD